MVRGPWGRHNLSANQTLSRLSEFECHRDQGTSLHLPVLGCCCCLLEGLELKHGGKFNKVIHGQIEDFETKDSTLSDTVVRAEGGQ